MSETTDPPSTALVEPQAVVAPPPSAPADPPSAESAPMTTDPPASVPADPPSAPADPPSAPPPSTAPTDPLAPALPNTPDSDTPAPAVFKLTELIAKRDSKTGSLMLKIPEKMKERAGNDGLMTVTIDTRSMARFHFRQESKGADEDSEEVRGFKSFPPFSSIKGSSHSNIRKVLKPAKKGFSVDPSTLKANWFCSLCNKPGDYGDLGPLFGPFDLNIPRRDSLQIRKMAAETSNLFEKLSGSQGGGCSGTAGEGDAPLKIGTLNPNPYFSPDLTKEEMTFPVKTTQKEDQNKKFDKFLDKLHSATMGKKRRRDKRPPKKPRVDQPVQFICSIGNCHARFPPSLADTVPEHWRSHPKKKLKRRKNRKATRIRGKQTAQNCTTNGIATRSLFVV
eukprot:sb/3465477/